jgi:acetyl esterase
MKAGFPLREKSGLMTRRWERTEEGQLPIPLTYRVYEGLGKATARPLVLYLPGTAFGPRQDRESDAPAALAMAEAGALVVEADCGTPSGHSFPGSLEQGFEVLKYMFAKRRRYVTSRSPVILAGDESGGNIAASLALKARDAMPGELAGQVLLSPMIDPRMVSASFSHADEIGMRERWSNGWERYLASACGYQHPYAAPCLCSRLAGVAPVLLVTSDDDPLRDEGLDYAERLHMAGVSVKTRVLSDQDGWTGLYEGRSGAWCSRFSTEFSQFMEELPI